MLHATSYCGSFLSADTIELRFRWCRDDGVPNSAYFEEESLRLESIVGADRNGPRKLVWNYDGAITVVFPHDSEVRRLTGDAQKDMAAMMAILGPP